MRIFRAVRRAAQAMQAGDGASERSRA